jgi:hypothetical protein
MADSTIDRIELKLNGKTWNEVMLREYKNGRSIERKYSDVPKTLVMKLLNSSTAPTVADFDGWLREYDAAEKKKRQSDVPCEVGLGSDWWSASRD